jgi:hypothetical protein
MQTHAHVLVTVLAARRFPHASKLAFCCVTYQWRMSVSTMELTAAVNRLFLRALLGRHTVTVHTTTLATPHHHLSTPLDRVYLGHLSTAMHSCFTRGTETRHCELFSAGDPSSFYRLPWSVLVTRSHVSLQPPAAHRLVRFCPSVDLMFP